MGSGKVTVSGILGLKGRRKIVMITAYDYPMARLVDSAGVDGILVGDSLGMVVLGYGSTTSVTLSDMVRHTGAVARARPRALVIADMPFMTYETGPGDALRNASRLVRAGAEAVKVEGGEEVVEIVRRLVSFGIPVMGHIGLNPQRHLVHGYRMVGKTEEQARLLVESAKSLEEAGVFSIVIEFVPAGLARKITESLRVPTICIGAGPYCDGQIIVLHDILGLTENPPSFVKKYIDLGPMIREAVGRYVEEVRSGAFPGHEHYRD